MKYTQLPNTTLEVSKICLGTMTWGQQNSEAEGHAQLDLALEKGINFVDTAEMYSVPGNPKTQGSTERIIGSWLAKTGNRDKIILTSKITGPNRFFEHIRKNLDFSKEALTDAIHKSLERLQTDYLDLYQLHWPERGVNIFGTREYKHNGKWEDNIAEVIDRLEDFVRQGKIRHIGLSNETPWGVMRYMEEARKGKTKMISVQNSYNLLNRRDEAGLSEVLLRENIGYLPYSPLAFGQLSGKYLNGAKPENARVTLFPNYSRYQGKASFEATSKYYEIAKKHNLSLPQMALAFVRQQPFVTSTIIGATTLDQLSENIESVHVTLSEEILKEINAVHSEIPNPAP
ncbi:aryl-alcohol dehydrogenase-like predicted oxidoreductase [Ulvibacter sp. MAR_2010_11]|uniref:NADP(H)-dependent aldo-keto reductase n=1 Tax=Ulvibacter sp. MAR_2010_11 TaxID=1250229 RepID=UPI000C2BBEBB|nr:NADP(H)-dependent aldo-keto reductase [Ulvibacter sp. MAR_2010_11]PKA82736.1 aryl-alcohol dehydrogenase-like predicted oxidoreductase [Ulvibacter sp. MAR_2010_11]